ncbi:hypothetical protein TNCV_1789871 [Trichonephila clavipes]|nr:hypothetical protein TNCV_1789871 [Trichonephila clavipes]
MSNRRPSRASQLSAARSLRMSEPLALKTAQRIRNAWANFAIKAFTRAQLTWIHRRETQLNSGVPPPTTESNKGGQGMPVIWQKPDMRRLHGVHPEYNAVASERGSNG